MVDFNAEGTVATPLSDLLKMLILEKREYVLQSFLEYYKRVFEGKPTRENVVRAGLSTLWQEIKSMLKGSISKKEAVNSVEITQEVLERIKLLIFNKNNINDLEEAFDFISDYLYMKKIIQVDSRASYDGRSVSAVNRAKGL